MVNILPVLNTVLSNAILPLLQLQCPGVVETSEIGNVSLNAFANDVERRKSKIRCCTSLDYFVMRRCSVCISNSLASPGYQMMGNI